MFDPSQFPEIQTLTITVRFGGASGSLLVFGTNDISRSTYLPGKGESNLKELGLELRENELHSLPDSMRCLPVIGSLTTTWSGNWATSIPFTKTFFSSISEIQFLKHPVIVCMTVD